MKKELNIISIDPSKTDTGFFIKGGGREYTGVIENPICYTTAQAANNIYNTLKHLLYLGNWQQFDYGLIEDYAFNPKNKKSIIPLAEIGGVIRLVFDQSGIPLIAVPVQTWKSLMCVNQIDKQKNSKLYLETVNKYYNKDFKTTHEADAWLIYNSVQVILKSNYNLLPENTRAIRDKIEKIINKNASNN